jgi:hypothetical protein
MRAGLGKTAHLRFPEDQDSVGTAGRWRVNSQSLRNTEKRLLGVKKTWKMSHKFRRVPSFHQETPWRFVVGRSRVGNQNWLEGAQGLGFAGSCGAGLCAKQNEGLPILKVFADFF